jgi:MscS family membrane protein
MGSPETGVPFDEEVLARTTLGKSKVQVRLALQPRTDGAAVWIFPAATVADIDALYDTLGYGWAGDYLPPVFFEVRVWKIQLWQWLGILAALILGYILGMIVSYLVRKLLLRLAKLTRWDWDDEVVATMRGPLIGAGWALGFVVLTSFLALADKPRATMLGACKLLAILALGWFLMRLVDVAARQLMDVFEERGDDMGVAMIPVTRKILKPILAVIIFIVALQNIGVDVSGLLAGLGIGGLAFALAAKDTLANVFGSVAIAFDRPFKVGEFVKVGDLLGTVEDVGLRTTRLRTLDRTVIAIPNAQVADSKIENYAFRDRVRLVATFGVQYDTSQDQLRYIIDEFKRYLLDSDLVWQESWRVRFVGYGASSQDIEVYCYLATSDFNEFTAMREQVLLDLGQLVTAAGAEFAFPSQTVYVGKDSHADGKKAKQAAAQVAQRTEDGTLCIPEIPDAVREEAEDARRSRSADKDLGRDEEEDRA